MTSESGAQAEGRNAVPARRLRACTLAVVGVLVALSLATFDWQPDSFSSADNRMKAAAPLWDEGADGLSAFVGFTGEVDDYLEDRMGFRSELMAAYGLLNDRLFGVMTHPLYEYGKDGYTFFRFSDEPYDDDKLQLFARYVRSMQDYCEQRGIAFLYAISPEKARIYPEEVPDTVLGELPSSASRLKELLDAEGVNYVDQADAILDAKNQGAQVFNRTYDAGHWNSEGMHAGAQAIVEKLQSMGVDVDDIDLDDYAKEYRRQNALPASNYPIDETTFSYRLGDAESGTTLMEGYLDNLVMNRQYTSSWYYENDNRPDDPSVLMFQGSYYNTQGTMLHHQFGRFAMVHDYQNVYALAYYVDVFDPDIVVFENSDYTFSDTYYSSDYLYWANLPPTYEEFADLPVVQAEEGACLRFDPTGAIANFRMVVPGTVVEGEDSSDYEEAYVYVLAGDRVLGTVSNWDESYWWGASTADLAEVDEVTVAVVFRDRQRLYTCPVRGDWDGAVEGGDDGSLDLGAPLGEYADGDPDTWLGRARSVPFWTVELG